jgi:hypothetical protein
LKGESLDRLRRSLASATDEHGFSRIGKTIWEPGNQKFAESVFICVDLWLGFIPSHDYRIPQDG